jgi:hypothetical protein
LSASRRLAYHLTSDAPLTESTKWEQLGLIPTEDINVKEKHCSKCNTVKPVEEFYKHKIVGYETYCKPCQNENSRINSKKAMYVNGKRIPKSHPLHKAGRYKTFTDAAFDSLAKYELSKEGQVYIITNPNFPEWVKVGMAVDSEDRLNGYQTSSPFRDYELFTCWSVADRRSAESEAHDLLEKTYDRKGEWFNCTPDQAQSAMSELMEQHK